MKKIRILRTLSALAFIALVAFGLATHSGTGTLSAFGYKTISAICPLGSVESFLASKIFVPGVFVSLIVFGFICVIFGRIFCAWACPTPLFRKIFPKSYAKIEGEKAKDTPNISLYVLGGALGSSLIFGFPVFCLICPVGLTFAVIIAFWRLIGFNEPTWSLAVLPAILIVELIFFRYSCRKFCPLGALISLFSRANLFFKPSLDEKSCLRSKGVDCDVCHKACNEDIDLHEKLTSQKLSLCTKCMECSAVCPAHSISFSMFKKKKNEER